MRRMVTTYIAMVHQFKPPVPQVEKERSRKTTEVGKRKLIKEEQEG